MPLRLWLSKRPNGLLLLSKRKPIRTRVMGTDRDDLYLQPGEPVGVQNLCGLAEKQIGQELKPFESVQVMFSLEALK